jgi:hypothetical protein
MAQTRRKRRTKHRGNAAGIVEQRGRTSRPPTPEERKAERRVQARQNRKPKPPSWQRAATRSGVTTALFVAVVIIAMKRPVLSTIGLGAFVFLLYIPFGYYADLFFWRRFGDGRDAGRRGRSRTRR